MNAGNDPRSAGEREIVRSFLDRRARALRELAASLAAVEREAAIPACAVEALSGFRTELPFVLFYWLERSDTHYRLAAEFGTGGDGHRPAATAAVSPDADTPWRFAEAIRGGRIVEQDLPGKSDGAGSRASAAFIVPVDLAGEDGLPLVLVAGAPPELAAVQAYRDFHELIRIVLAGAVRTARAREAAETAIARAAERERLFLAELQHGVRNTLAVIRSIVRRTALASATVDDFSMYLESRLDAFARVRAAVARSPALGIDLASIVADELRTATVHESSNLTMDGPPVRLRPKAAESLALAIHELATNALKHGALSVGGGRIAVQWNLEEGIAPPVLDFRWRERGLKDVPAKPVRRGFGTELLERTLPYELKAQTRLSYEPEGLKCRIMLPLDHILADRDGNIPQNASGERNIGL